MVAILFFPGCHGGDAVLFMMPWWFFCSFQDAMVVILKSLVPACLFNIVGFGSTFRALFPTSQNYGEVKNPKGQSDLCYLWHC